MDNEDGNPGFTISSENPDFQSKVHDVFDGISGLRSNFPTKDDGSSISEVPVNDKPHKPDFVVHPSRYTKYSLRDTELSSNAANSQIAFQFLEKLSPNDSDDAENPADQEASPFSKKHVFKMPEQPAGICKPKERKVSKEKEPVILSCDKVELDHLEENIAVAEFTSEIAQKLEETIKNSTPQTSAAPVEGTDEKFKHINKKRRSLRQKAKG